jgi:hypothetical protein
MADNKSTDDVTLTEKDGTEQRNQSNGFNTSTVTGTDDLSEFVSFCI